MMISILNVFPFILYFITLGFFHATADETLLAISIVDDRDQSDSFKQYVRSLEVSGYKYEIYVLDDEISKVDFKVKTLIRELEKWKDDKEKVIFFTKGYDVIITQNDSYVLDVFKRFNSRLVFGADVSCLPNDGFKSKYPNVGTHERRFLNSDGFIGYASDVYELISSVYFEDDETDQTFYTKIFLDSLLRKKYEIKLDTRSKIFQNLNGALDDVEVVESNGLSLIYNKLTKTYPASIQANDASKMILNRFGNYIAKAYSDYTGCIICNEDKIVLSQKLEKEWPYVTVGIFIEQATPFLREFFEKFAKLNYPKSKITLLIHINVEKYHDKIIENFFTDPLNQYALIKYIKTQDDSPAYEAMSEAISDCNRNDCGYYLCLSSLVHIDNPETLRLLIEQNRSILSPIMTRPDTVWSNVWGSVTSSGFYSRSVDYFDIIGRNKTGVWNMPYISSIYLIQNRILKELIPAYESTIHVTPNIAFSNYIRRKNIFMYATNMDTFGHLINPDNYNISLARPEMFEIINNLKDWADRYIHNEYRDFLTSKKNPLQPCRDVFWAPILNDEACEDLIVVMEDYGQWSGGNDNNTDLRLSNGYENVPTVDIHFTQINFQSHWLYFLKKFVQPIQMKVFAGYYSETPRADLNFVVRYRPGEQDHLRPHHDASKYTINIALNQPGVDFQGGGCRFVSLNCTVTKTRKGWLFLHPGRVTHYHEGLKVTGGTRYILVSFVDN